MDEAVKSDADLVLCDTSGRLHTNWNLMDELAKCKRSITKRLPEAPHEVGCAGTRRIVRAARLRDWACRCRTQLHVTTSSQVHLVWFQCRKGSHAGAAPLEVGAPGPLGSAHPSVPPPGLAPVQVLLVLDGTTGLNMLNQAKEFNETVQLSGIILTKLDGTARGGAVVSAPPHRCFALGLPRPAPWSPSAPARPLQPCTA